MTRRRRYSKRSYGPCELVSVHGTDVDGRALPAPSYLPKGKASRATWSTLPVKAGRRALLRFYLNPAPRLCR